MNKTRAYCSAGLLSCLIVGCGEVLFVPPPPSEPTWNLLATGETFIDVWGASPHAVFALGEASLFYYNESSWSVLPDPPAGSTAIWGTSPENLLVVAGGDVYHFDGHAWDVVVLGPTPPYPLSDIWGSSDRDIFAVGKGGTIFHFDGSAWSQMPSGKNSDLLCLWGTSGTEVYAAGAEGTVLHYDGSKWSDVSAESSWAFSSIWAGSTSDIYCVGLDLTLDGNITNDRSVLHYDGSSWRSVVNQTGRLWSIWGSSSADVFVVGDGPLLHFDGVSWSQRWLWSLSARAIWGSSSQDVFVVGGGDKGTSDQWYMYQGSLLFHYDGTEWRRQASSVALDNMIFISGIGGSSPTDIYFIGGQSRESDSEPAIQRFNGSSFGQLSGLAMTEHPFRDVWATSDAVFAVGASGAACFDPFLAEPPVTKPLGISGTCIWATSRINAFVAGHAGEISHYDGSTWAPMATGTTSSLYDIWGSSESDVFAVGMAGTILHFDGSSWVPMQTGTGNDLWGVWGRSSMDVYAVGDLGTILHYDGAQWNAVPSMTQNRLTGVWTSSDRDVFVVGGIILHYDGKTWTRMGTTHHAQKVWGTGAGDVFVTEGNRVLHYGF